MKHFGPARLGTPQELLQDIIIENLPIQKEEASHPTRIAMGISGSIQGSSVIAELIMVATKKSYFIKST